MTLHLLLLILCMIRSAKSQACSSYQTAIACDASPACSWIGDYCRCTSDAKLDILFALDASGSVTQTAWDLSITWLEKLVSRDVSLNARMGFTIFSTAVNESRRMQYWNETELINYVPNLIWSAGWTATGSLISTSLWQFEDLYESDREQLFVIQTDGNPCSPPQLGGCPYSVCQYKEELQSMDIQTAMIGIGEDLETAYVECIADYYFAINDYDSLESLPKSRNTALSDLLCPEIALPLLPEDNFTAGITSIAPHTTWIDDMNFYENDYMENPYGGNNWYSSNNNGAVRNTTTNSTDSGMIHGWFTMCNIASTDDPCNADQINRAFQCNRFNNFDKYEVTVSFNVYRGCYGGTNSADLWSYSRFSASTGTYITTFYKSTLGGSTVTESSAAELCASITTFIKYDFIDLFYVDSSETINIAMWPRWSTSRTDTVIAFGGFQVSCVPVTEHPTMDPTTDPTVEPTTSHPTSSSPTTSYPTTSYPTTSYPTTSYPTNQTMLNTTISGKNEDSISNMWIIITIAANICLCFLIIVAIIIFTKRNKKRKPKNTVKPPIELNGVYSNSYHHNNNDKESLPPQSVLHENETGTESVNQSSNVSEYKMDEMMKTEDHNNNDENVIKSTSNTLNTNTTIIEGESADFYDNINEYESIEETLKKCDNKEWEKYLYNFKKHKMNENRLKHITNNEHFVWEQLIPEFGVRLQFIALWKEKQNDDDINNNNNAMNTYIAEYANGFGDV